MPDIGAARIYLNRGDKLFIAGFGIVGDDILKRDEHLNFLHPREREYYKSLKHDLPRRSYLLGRAAGKKAIAALIPEVKNHDILIDRGVFGFPVVRGLAQNIQVSISTKLSPAALVTM